jgi:hypothetical protein
MTVNRDGDNFEIVGVLDINPQPFKDRVEVTTFIEIGFNGTRYTGVIEQVNNQGYMFSILPDNPPFVGGDLIKIGNENILAIVKHA